MTICSAPVSGAVDRKAPSVVYLLFAAIDLVVGVEELEDIRETDVLVQVLST